VERSEIELKAKHCGLNVFEYIHRVKVLKRQAEILMRREHLGKRQMNIRLLRCNHAN
jgi:hypothetical protein